MMKRSGMVVLLMAIVGGALFPARSYAIQACVNPKTGATRTLLSGGACKKTEKSVPMPLQLVDEAGKFAGPAEYFDGSAYADVVLPVGGALYNFDVDSATGFVDSGPDYYIVFSTSDCSATPYLAPFPAGDYYPPNIPNPLVRSTYGGYGPFIFSGVLYYPTALSLLTIESVGIFSDPTQPFSQCIKFTSPENITVGPISTFNLSTLGFQPPFHLQ
jgi:hypothetical protein